MPIANCCNISITLYLYRLQHTLVLTVKKKNTEKMEFGLHQPTMVKTNLHFSDCNLAEKSRSWPAICFWHRPTSS